MLADDDETIRDVTRFALEEEGYAVEEASDGVTALHILRTSGELLVAFLDNRMPRLNGVDILRQARHDMRLTRHAFVLWSATSQLPVPKEFLQDLQVLTLAKPCELDEVLAIVAEATERLAEERDA